MDPIRLKRHIGDEDNSVSRTNLENCIFCNKDNNIITTENGRKKIRDAAAIRKDKVWEKLSGIAIDDLFYYHVNNECYKQYCHKKSLDILIKRTSLQSSDSRTQPSNSIFTEDKPCRKKPRRQSTSSTLHIRDRLCVICNNKSHKGTYEKFRICESPRAEMFLQATAFFQDDVFVRTCDLQDAPRVFGADIMYHKSCFSSYMLRYEREHEQSGTLPQVSESLKKQLFNKISEELEKGINNGLGYTLSYIREKLNSQSIITINNRELKTLLVNHFGEKITFSNPVENNKPAIFFSSKLTAEEVADAIQSHNPITECANVLRQSIKNLDYDLSDKFCDSNDLKDSWFNTKIPPAFSQFFCSLFNINPSQTNIDHSNENEETTFSGWAIKAQSLLQIMFYMLHRGKKKTPLHLMNAQAIHEACRSKTLITSFNRLGLCVGYDEVLRHHSALAQLTVTQSGDIPLPSHFSPDMYTISAFDNFDHTEATFSGLGSTHDTVCVLLQDKPTVSIQKPRISESSVEKKQKRLYNTLPCQNLQPYIKPAKRPDLINDYKVDDDLYFMDENEFKTYCKKDNIWQFLRIAHTTSETKMTDLKFEQPSPSWSAFNSLVSRENLQEKNVGFLPILPHSVTKYETVYTVLCNLNKLLMALKQENLAIACDESVYCIAREIQMSRRKQFENLLLIMGSFHMTKVFIGCLGKYIRKSGASDIFIESGLLGVNVAESALSGKNYVRGVKAMFILDEALFRLQVLSFFEANGIEKYAGEIKQLQNLQKSLSAKEYSKLRSTFDNIDVDNLIYDFQEFVDEGRQSSENFLYWDNFRIFVSLLRNLIRSDREGLWNLHLDTVQKIQPLLAVFDCVNYQRWSSLYLEDMRKLPTTHPEVYEAFMKGKHVVKRFSHSFSAVGADMALEQTINRSQKGSSGVIGMTKQKQFVAQWDLTYHELLQITNLHREITQSTSTTSDLHLHHEFRKSETEHTNSMIVTIVQYILKRENPFEFPGNRSLHNIVTQVEVAVDAKNKLLNVSKLGIELYRTYRETRYIKKSARIWDTISRTKLPTFETQNNSEKKGKDKLMKQRFKTATNRIVQIAQVRGYEMARLFQFELSDSSMLFDDYGLLVKSQKSQLTKELEKNLSNNAKAVQFQPDKSTCFILDVMNCLRKVVTKEKKTFGDVATSYSTFTLSLSAGASRVDHVFDSYQVCSPKDSERLSRQKSNVIIFSKISSEINLPVQMDTFWPSSANKLLLQKHIAQSLNSLMVTTPISQVHVLSAFSGSPGETSVSCVSIENGVEKSIRTMDRLTIEEADFRMMIHAENVARKGLKKIVFVSADTDILVLALFHWKRFHTLGVNEIWIRTGVGDTTRLIPIHLLAATLGQDMCQALPALHALSGADYTSKFGTKKAAIGCNPEQYLKGFGLSPLSPEIDRIMALAEEYLVQLLKKGSSCKTLDDFRLWKYLHGKNISLDDLPPTSTSAQGHLLRAFFHTYLMVHCLDTGQETLDPLKFGFEVTDSVLMPSKYINPLPDDYIGACTCIKCATSSCVCRDAEIQCCLFCKCNSVEIGKIDCRNPFSI